MKWVNKGHEYDNMYAQILKKKKFYLFGAGDYGHQFIKLIKDEINISGYIDNDPKKQGSLINGNMCFPLYKAEIPDDDTGVIVTISQIQRGEPVKQLEEAGLKRNIDYFIIEEFISVYFVYKYNKVYFSSISFLPSTICNLKCRNCLNFNPFASQFYIREWEALVKDVDSFFSCVDYIMLFHISGGEPMLYRYTGDLIAYIDQKYGDRIDTLRTVTNGTVVPSDELLEKMSKSRIEITVDDYREAVPEYSERFSQLINKLEEYHIRYFINRAEEWIDLLPEEGKDCQLSEEELIRHRSACNQSWQELRDGKLYSCNYAAYATVAGISGKQDEEETYDLRTHVSVKNKELVEFRLGYTDKGYTNFCKKCRGFKNDNNEWVKPAQQVK